MAKVLHGPLNLSRIPKELISTNKAGEKIVWVDVAERRTIGAHGETHYITLYNKNTRQKVYLADLAPQEIGGGQQQAPAPANGYRQRPAAPAPAPAPQPAPAPVNEETDLPFS